MRLALVTRAVALGCTTSATRVPDADAGVGGAGATGGTSSAGGGQAGSSSSGGGNGGAGGVEPGVCAAPDDCPGIDSECAWRSCDAGVCGVVHAPPGTPVSMQIAGDCAIAVCDGSGAIGSTYDEADLVPDDTDCTTDACAAQGPTYTEIGAPPYCHAKCVPSSPQPSPQYRACSGVLLDGDGLVGVVWLDDMGTADTSDDVTHWCGDPAEIPANAGDCPPGKACDAMLKTGNALSFVAGYCE